MAHSNSTFFAFIKPLYYLANILGISPPYYVKTGKETIIKYGFKTWTIIVGLMQILTYGYCMEGASRTIFSQVKMTTTVIQIILFTFITLSNVISVFGAGFFNVNSWITLLSTLNKVHRKLNISFKKKQTKIFYSFVFLGHVFFILVLGFDFYVGQSTHGFEIYQYHFIFRIQFYFVFIIVILTCFFASSIRHSFYYFNKMLRSIKTLNESVFTINPKQVRNSISPLTLQTYKSTDINKVTCIFTTLTDIVELYNQIFGWQMLMLMGIVLMTLLESFNFIMVAEISKEEHFGLQSNNKIPSKLLITAEFLIWGVLVIIFCDKANKEIQNSANISFQILPEITETNPDFRKILYLAQQTANRCPQLSAANVFDVNISTLFALLGSLTTYVVVVIQFNTM